MDNRIGTAAPKRRASFTAILNADLFAQKRSPTMIISPATAKAAHATQVLRVEGKSYVVQDGDVMHFLFNA